MKYVANKTSRSSVHVHFVFYYSCCQFPTLEIRSESSYSLILPFPSSKDVKFFERIFPHFVFVTCADYLLISFDGDTNAQTVHSDRVFLMNIWKLRIVLVFVLHLSLGQKDKFEECIHLFCIYEYSKIMRARDRNHGKI